MDDVTDILNYKKPKLDYYAILNCSHSSSVGKTLFGIDNETTIDIDSIMSTISQHLIHKTDGTDTRRIQSQGSTIASR